MKLSQKQRFVIEHLREGWMIRVLMMQGCSSRTWLFKNAEASSSKLEVPILISYLTVASLRNRFCLKQVPTERTDERVYEYSAKGELEANKTDELKSLRAVCSSSHILSTAKAIPAFAF